MASLATEIALRFGNQRLASLTTPDSTGAAAVDSTKLAQAETSAGQWFKTWSGETIDTDDVMHVECGVFIMEALLLTWGGGTTSEAERKFKDAEKFTRAYSRTAKRGPVKPTSSTKRTPSDDPAVKPDTDRTYWNDLRLDPPNAFDDPVNEN